LFYAQEEAERRIVKAF